MITLKVLAALGFVSLLFTAVLKVMDLFRTSHAQRLLFIKSYIALTVILPAAAVIIAFLRAGRAVGELLPLNSALPGVEGAMVPVKVLAAQHGWLVPAALVIYFAVLTVLLGRLLYFYTLTRVYLSSARPEQLAGREVFARKGIASPFSFGILRPRIFVPIGYAQGLPREAVNMALAHEEIHIRNGDPAWKILSLIARAGVFFSPAARYLHRRLDLEMEIECDRRTIGSASASVEAYGNFLLDTVVSLQAPAPNPLLTHISDTNIKRRIQAMKMKTSKRMFVMLFCGFAAAAGSLSAIAAATGVTKLGGQYLIKAQIYVDGQLVSSPQIMTLRDEKALIEMATKNPETELKLKMVASDYAGGNIADGIELNMDLEYKNSDRRFAAKPHLAVVPGQEASVTIASDAKGSLELKITAERL